MLRIAAPSLTVACTDASESPPVLGDAPPPLGGDAPLHKAPRLLLQAKAPRVMRLQAKVQRA